MSRKYKFHKPEAAYFISFATVNWIDLFTREVYFDVLAQSVTYCRKNKVMELYVYCFMPNHVHMIFRSTNENPSALIRDFKGYTSKKLIQTIQENPKESRKEYLLEMFEKAGKSKSNIQKYQLWQHHNQPMELYSNKVIEQKVNYVHMNPVEEGLVTNPIDWKYSSARNYAGDQTILEIDLMGSKA
ncbi:MAG: transposase [Crocinitomicaceae bacterium]